GKVRARPYLGVRSVSEPDVNSHVTRHCYAHPSHHHQGKTAMQKPTTESGFLNPRIFAAIILFTGASGLLMFTIAAPAPASGTLSISNRSVTYTDSTGAPPNLTGVALGKPNCGPPNAACSLFNVTVHPTCGPPAAVHHLPHCQIKLPWLW